MKTFILLLHKVVRFFLCLKLKISITAKLMKKLHIGSRIVLSYFKFRFNPWDGFRLFFFFFLNPLNTEQLDSKGAAARPKKIVM